MFDFKVKCIDDKGGAFKKGKVYPVIDGKMKYEDGTACDTLFSCLERINERFYSKFELVEESKMFTKEDIQSGDKIFADYGATGIVILFKDDLVVRYTDHSGYDYVNTIFENGVIQKVIRPTTPFEMVSGQETHGTVIFDRKNGIGCEPQHKFEVGDKVKVCEMGHIYPTYGEFVANKSPQNASKYIENGRPNNGVTLMVIAHGQHMTFTDSSYYLYIVQDPTTRQVFLFGEDGLEKV